MKKQVSISSVMAFGNHGNDVDLLASCGYGVAMKMGVHRQKKPLNILATMRIMSRACFDL